MKRLTPLDLVQNELQNARIQNLGSAPGTPVEGQIYYDTGTDILYFRNASAWVSTNPASLLGTANTWTNSNAFNGAITGNNTINLTGVGGSSVLGNFSAVILIATGNTGATAASRYAGAVASGAPASGTYAIGDFTIDQTGTIRVCTGAGTPGTHTAVGQYLLGQANTWTANQTFNTSILGNGTINLTGSGAHSVGGVFTATQHIASGQTGAAVSTKYAGGTASGSPGSGTFSTGDWIVTTGGDAYVCTAGGTPGTWARVGSYLLGTNNTWTGTNIFNNAVSGSGTITMTAGVTGSFVSASGLTGAVSASRYVGATASAAPSTGTFVTGDFAIGQNGSVFVCTAGGSPGTWTTIGSAGSSYSTVQANGSGVTQRAIVNFINGTYTTATAVDNTTKSDVKFDVTVGSVTAQTSFGAGSSNGTGTALSLTNHTHGTPTHDGAAHSAISISSLSNPTADRAWGGFKITGLGDPTSAQDAATKNYVDLARQGLEYKDSVKAATTAALANTPTYANGTAGVGATLTSTGNAAFPAQDGQTLSTIGDRVLVKDQASSFQNGIYTLTQVGSGAAQWILTRATDNDSSSSTPARMAAGDVVYVDAGTTNGGQLWVMNQTAAITMGTTGITWAQISGASTATAGAGLTATGNVLAVGASTGISVGADTVGIDTAVVVRKYAVAVGDNSSVAIVVTHNLGTQDVTVGVYLATGTFEEVGCDIEHTSTNTVTLRFAVAPTTGQYRCVVHG